MAFRDSEQALRERVEITERERDELRSSLERATKRIALLQDITPLEEELTDLRETVRVLRTRRGDPPATRGLSSAVVVLGGLLVAGGVGFYRAHAEMQQRTEHYEAEFAQLRAESDSLRQSAHVCERRYAELVEARARAEATPPVVVSAESLADIRDAASSSSAVPNFPSGRATFYVVSSTSLSAGRTCSVTAQAARDGCTFGVTCGAEEFVPMTTVACSAVRGVITIHGRAAGREVTLVEDHLSIRDPRGGDTALRMARASDRFESGSDLAPSSLVPRLRATP